MRLTGPVVVGSLAFASTASATVTITKPLADQKTGDVVLIEAMVSPAPSEAPTVEGGSGSPTKATCSGEMCTATIDFAYASAGSHLITVKAGSSGSATVRIVLDAAPALSVTKGPVPHIAHPGHDTFAVGASCTDPDATGCTVRVHKGSVTSPVVASSASSIDTTVTFGAADASESSLVIEAIDGSGRHVWHTTPMWTAFEPLTKVLWSAEEGMYVDDDATRMLFKRRADSTIVVRTLATKADVAITPAAAARLTPFGVVYETYGDKPVVTHWKPSGSTVIVPGRIAALTGRYLAIREDTATAWGAAAVRPRLYDLQTETTLHFPTTFEMPNAASACVNEAGRFVFWMRDGSFGAVKQYKDGVVSDVLPYPVKSFGCQLAGDILLYGTDSSAVYGDVAGCIGASGGALCPYDGVARNGWMAYRVTEFDFLGLPTKTWFARRAPSGATDVFASPPTVPATGFLLGDIDAKGTVAFAATSKWSLAHADGSTQELVPRALGRVFHRDGKWLGEMGFGLVQLATATSAPDDTGADAAADAGTDATPSADSTAADSTAADSTAADTTSEDTASDDATSDGAAADDDASEAADVDAPDGSPTPMDTAHDGGGCNVGSKAGATSRIALAALLLALRRARLRVARCRA